MCVWFFFQTIHKWLKVIFVKYFTLISRNIFGLLNSQLKYFPLKLIKVSKQVKGNICRRQVNNKISTYSIEFGKDQMNITQWLVYM